MGKPELTLFTTVVTVIKEWGQRIQDLPATMRDLSGSPEVLIGYQPDDLAPFRLERNDKIEWIDPDGITQTYYVGQWVSSEQAEDGQYYYKAFIFLPES